MSNNMQKDLKSWKTSLVGLIGALIVWLPQILAIIQGEPVSVKAIAIGLAILSGGIVAKDGDKSTEDVSQ